MRRVGMVTKKKTNMMIRRRKDPPRKKTIWSLVYQLERKSALGPKSMSKAKNYLKETNSSRKPRRRHLRATERIHR